jgi:hypothetical protein
MIRVVIDTSVLVSAVISPTGPNARLLDFIVAKQIRPYLTEAPNVVRKRWYTEKTHAVDRVVSVGKDYRTDPGRWVRSRFLWFSHLCRWCSGSRHGVWLHASAYAPLCSRG